MASHFKSDSLSGEGAYDFRAFGSRRAQRVTVHNHPTLQRVAGRAVHELASETDPQITL